MKIAFISDIHGNIQALSSTLIDIKKQHIDHLFVLGDVATLGPNPKETIELLSQQDAIFIRGNHDDTLISMNEKHFHDNNKIPPAYQWTFSQLSQEHINILKRYSDTATLAFSNDKHLLAFHASPWSNTESLHNPLDFHENNQRLSKYSESLLVSGHDHYQYQHNKFQKVLVGVGSVGFPYKEVPFKELPKANAWSEYVIITIKNNKPIINFRKVEYDLRKFHQATTQSNSPLKAWLSTIGTLTNKAKPL